jgi:16S rRNA processing protein RimM
MSHTKERPAGPPTTGGPVYLVVGKVRRPHGVHGEVVVEIYTNFPERICLNKEIYLGEMQLKMVVTSMRPHNEGLLLSFDGINNPEEAGRYRNQIISIIASEGFELPKGEYYFHQLLDLNVEDEAGQFIGNLTEILETGANDVYVVLDLTGHELLLPAIPDVIQKVDLDKGTIIVRMLPGLVNDRNE